MSKFLSNLIHTRPTLREHKLFSLSSPAAKEAHMLSRTDWREWLPSAIPPFRKMIIEWPTTMYLRSGENERIICMGDAVNLEAENDRGVTPELSDIYFPKFPDNTIEHLALIVTEMVDKDETTLAVAMDMGPRRKPLIGPWIVSELGASILDADAVQPSGEFLMRLKSLAWGKPMIDKYGLPPTSLLPVCPNPSFDGIPVENMERLMEECIGQIRVALAVLALVNAERDTIIVPASQRNGRMMSTMKGAGSIPRYEPTEIIIRPDLPRRVYERTKALMPGSPKCHHEVKGHWRYLDRRPNHHWEEWKCEDGVVRWRRFIKEHERGDRALGTTAHTYAVDVDPAR